MKKKLEESVKAIKENSYRILDSKLEKAKKEVNHHTSYVCPICGHGKHGDGLTVIPNTNTLKCFSCNFTGSVIDLFMKSENKNFLEVVTELSSLQGIEINNAISDPVTEEIKNVITEPIEENLEEYYKQTSNYFLNSPLAQNYLYRRGIHLETALSTGCIGFDPQSDPARNNHPYPRILFFKGERGILSHYNARIVEDDSLPVLDRKYAKLKPKGLSEKGFFNSTVLEETDSSYNVVFICEGEIDCLSFMEINKPAIALSSKSRGKAFVEYLKDERISKKKQFVVTLDNDPNKQTNKANRAEERELVEELSKLGYKAISYPISGKYKDINECLVKDRTLLEENTEKAMEEIKKDELDMVIDRILQRDYVPLKSGVSWFDELKILNKKTLTLLLASPSTGKTSLCQQIACSIAKSGRDIEYLNLEMSNDQMLIKDLTRTIKEDPALTDIDSIYNVVKDSEQFNALETAVKKYRQTVYKHLRYSNESNDISDIIKRLEKRAEENIANQKETPIVFVDYLHLISDKENQANDERLKNIVYKLKSFSIKYNTAVIAISATNRSSNAGNITMSSGRDTSNLEYTADNVLSLDYTRLENTDQNKQQRLLEEQSKEIRELTLRVLKARYGAIGKSVTLKFHAKDSYFEEYRETKIEFH